MRPDDCLDRREESKIQNLKSKIPINPTLAQRLVISRSSRRSESPPLRWAFQRGVRCSVVGHTTEHLTSAISLHSSSLEQGIAASSMINPDSDFPETPRSVAPSRSLVA